MGDKSPRLVLAKAIQGTPKYATLSHCWGKMESLRLSRENLGEFKTGIPSEALPPSFKDAINMARGLDIEYLWIDSLCIIQDKESDDWSKESSKMSFVYGNSFVNLAATSAEDGKGGFFPLPINKKPSAAFMVDAVLESGVTRLTCLLPAQDRDFDYGRDRELLPLINRGWVLQERILSPRTVHFTTNYIFWECCQNKCYSGFVPSMPNRNHWKRTPALEHFSKLPMSNYEWKHITEEYSQTKLTYKRDKLIAIAGIARALQPIVRSRYCAGIWEKDLPHQLMWRALSPSLHNVVRSKAEYRGPTWSWVSMDCDVKFVPRKWARHPYSHVKICGLDIELEGSDAYGPVSDAKLYLQCKKLFTQEDWVSCLKVDEFYWKTIDLGLGFEFDEGFAYDSNYILIRKDPVWILPLLSEPQDSRVVGLLLRPTCVSQGEYQRVGIFNTDFLDKKINSSPLQQAVHDGSIRNPWPIGSYTDINYGEDGMSFYGITII